MDTDQLYWGKKHFWRYYVNLLKNKKLKYLTKIFFQIRYKEVLNICEKLYVAPWCSGYHYCTTSFNKVWTQALCRFKSCSQHVGDSRWWESLIMVPPGNKAKCLSSVNYTTKRIHHHHHHIWWCKSLIKTRRSKRSSCLVTVSCKSL